MIYRFPARRCHTATGTDLFFGLALMLLPAGGFPISAMPAEFPLSAHTRFQFSEGEPFVWVYEKGRKKTRFNRFSGQAHEFTRSSPSDQSAHRRGLLLSGLFKEFL